MSGTHIKALRIQLGLSQQELAGPSITRNLLSMIENGRTPLSIKTAELLAERINELFSDQSGFEPVTIQDLSTPGRYQARLEVRALLSSIAEFRDESHFNVDLYLSKISGLFSEWDLPEEKTQAYMMIASYFEDVGRNQEAHLYYSRAYENAARLENPSTLAQTALSLSRTALKLEHYHSAILSAEALRSYEGRIPVLMLLEVFLNQAIAYMAEQDHDKALDSLIFCEHLVPGTPPTWEIQLLTLKVDCYISKRMIGIANRILTTLENRSRRCSTEEAAALRITTCCLRGRMHPAGLSADTLKTLWQEFAANPSAIPHYEQHFLRLMDAAQQTEQPELFEQIAWRALTDISPIRHPVASRHVMERILTAWSQRREMALIPHWKYYLTNEACRSTPGYAAQILSFLRFFSAAGYQDLIQEALSLKA